MRFSNAGYRLEVNPLSLCLAVIICVHYMRLTYDIMPFGNVSDLLVNAEKRYMEKSAGKLMTRWVRESYLNDFIHFSVGQVRAHYVPPAQVFVGGRGR